MKKLIENLLQNWPTYFFEILVLIIGIYGAFALDSWNDQQNQAKEEKKILDNLNVEFKRNREELEVSIDRMNRVISGLDSLLSLMRNGYDDLSRDDFELLLETTFGAPIWTPSSFVLEDIKSSGGLSRLSDDSLKIMLFDWERKYSNTISSEKGYTQYSIEYIEYISLQGSARNLDALGGQVKGFQKSSIASNRLEFLVDPVFENRVDNFYWLATITKNHYSEILLKMDGIIARTETIKY